ncbi:MAG: hypothetical protein AAF551_11720 [Bacteroidota bacterium]
MKAHLHKHPRPSTPGNSNELGINKNTTIVDNRPSTMHQRHLLEKMNRHTMVGTFPPLLQNESVKPNRRKADTRDLPDVPVDRRLVKPTQRLSKLPAPAIQRLERNQDGDKEKLGWVYHVVKGFLSSTEEQPNKDLLKEAIYHALSLELDAKYQVQGSDVDLLDHHFSQKDDVLLGKETGLPSKTPGELTYREKATRIAANRKAFKEGKYFHVFNPNDESVSSERMVVNVLSQQDAMLLLKDILKGWESEVNDWSAHVLVAKVLGVSPKGKGNRDNHLKYDKVVIYYKSAHRETILEHVKAVLPEDKRVSALPAFYRIAGKGIGIGKERTDNVSFTEGNAIALTNWVLEEGWESLKQGMSMKEFVSQGLEKVLDQL